ncbi:MAG TPA: intradiol ring-cleavage dioxygenase [Actinomycetota bacterium]|nr:intradiol ring-cleavage dioxygenase [Actinomycetota bacterium]
MGSEPSFEGRPLPNPDEEIFDQGLSFDVGTLLDRRRVLVLAGSSVLGAALAACGLSSTSTSSGAATNGSASTDETIPEETAGPYPADGSNGPDVLTQSGIVRRDIRSSFGGMTGTAAGVPLEIRLAIEDAATGAPLPGAAVYVWHCDRDGGYSLYTVTDRNYLRGVQPTGDDGVATFTSVFPACYAGRWPHIHFEVYRDLASAAAGEDRLATSQIALPQATCEEVYATEGYARSVTNLQQVSLATDMVFGDDGGVRQLGTITGSVANGLAVRLAAPVTEA